MNRRTVYVIADLYFYFSKRISGLPRTAVKANRSKAAGEDCKDGGNLGTVDDTRREGADLPEGQPMRDSSGPF